MKNFLELYTFYSLCDHILLLVFVYVLCEG